MNNLSNVAAPGNTRAATHGAFSEKLVGPIAADTLVAVDEMCAGRRADMDRLDVLASLVLEDGRTRVDELLDELLSQPVDHMQPST